MAVNLSPIWGAGAQLLDNSGNVLSGGKIYTYAAGTTTQVTTYTDGTGTTAHSNPIVLNSAGRVPYEIWLTDGQNYKFVLKDSNDVLIGTWNNLSGINSNFIAYTNQQEIQTATAGQTVFNLTTMQYLPGTGNLSVFVDGVNQYGPDAQYAFEETDQTTVTFTAGLHVGALVKFTSTQIQNAGIADASQISYTYPDSNAITQNVEERLAQTVSVKDFGAVGDGITDDTAAFQTATNTGLPIYVPATTNFYVLTSLPDSVKKLLYGDGKVVVNGVYKPISSVWCRATPETAGINVIQPDLQPSTLTQVGAVYAETTRTGGIESYGNFLSQYLVKASVPSGAFDVGMTSWISSTNLDGGSNFAAWLASNTPARNYQSSSFTSGSSLAVEINVGNRWADFGYQNDIGGTRSTTGLLIAPAATAGAQDWNYQVSISIANPAVITWTDHGLSAGTPVTFSLGVGGVLPSSIVAGTVYYVISAGLATNSFQISATRGGTAIDTSGDTTSGQILAKAWFPGSFGLVIARSVMWETFWTGTFVRDDTIQANGVTNLYAGGTTAITAPAYCTYLRGYYGAGFDTTTATFSGPAVNLGNNQFLNIGGSSMTGNAGALSLSVTSGTLGQLMSNSFGNVNLSWSYDGTNPRLGFYGAAAAVKQTVTGSTGGNAALESLLDALSTIGLITDSTTP